MREYIVAVEDDVIAYEEYSVGYIRRQKKLIRCKDCENWKQTEEGIGECVIFNTGDYRFRSTADFFCNMAEPKEKVNGK